MLVSCHPFNLNKCFQISCKLCEMLTSLLLKNISMNSWRTSDLSIVLINRVQIPPEHKTACVFGFLWTNFILMWL